MLDYGFNTQRSIMKINSKQFRARYNIPRSTESYLKKMGVVPFEKVGRMVVYDTDITDKLAQEEKLGANAFIAVNNILNCDGSEEHY